MDPWNNNNSDRQFYTHFLNESSGDATNQQQYGASGSNSWVRHFYETNPSANPAPQGGGARNLRGARPIDLGAPPYAQGPTNRQSSHQGQGRTNGARGRPPATSGNGDNHQSQSQPQSNVYHHNVSWNNPTSAGEGTPSNAPPNAFREWANRSTRDLNGGAPQSQWQSQSQSQSQWQTRAHGQTQTQGSGPRNPPGMRQTWNNSTNSRSNRYGRNYNSGAWQNWRSNGRNNRHSRSTTAEFEVEINEADRSRDSWRDDSLDDSADLSSIIRAVEYSLEASSGTLGERFEFVVPMSRSSDPCRCPNHEQRKKSSSGGKVSDLLERAKNCIWKMEKKHFDK